MAIDGYDKDTYRDGTPRQLWIRRPQKLAAPDDGAWLLPTLLGIGLGLIFLICLPW